MIFCKCKLHTTRSGLMQILRKDFLMSRSRLDLHQALLANSFRKRQELQFFSTCNAFITILSSRVILPWGAEIAGVDIAAPSSKGGHRGSGHCGSD